MYRKDVPVSGELMCKCKHCLKQYDLRIAEDASRQKNIRTIKCPECKKRIGTTN